MTPPPTPDEGLTVARTMDCRATALELAVRTAEDTPDNIPTPGTVISISTAEALRAHSKVILEVAVSYETFILRGGGHTP